MKVKEIWKKMTTDQFKSDLKETSLKEVFINNKKGRKNYMLFLLNAKTITNKPAETIH